MKNTTIEKILDLARWAPSGDNNQPWRFRVTGEGGVTLYSKNSARDNVYEYKNGEPNLLATGMLLENIRIAASVEKMRATWEYVGLKDNHHILHITFVRDDGIVQDPLFPFVISRSVDRKKYRKSPLDLSDKMALQEALGGDLAVDWYETRDAKKTIAKLNARATDIRLQIPEAYKIHQQILEWNKSVSEDKIPVGTLPVSAPSKIIMRWVLGGWKRAVFMNRFLFGTKMPQWEMDIIPGIHCAAHFILSSDGDCSAVRILCHGQAIQRFWLTATKLRLALQPSFATLIFSHYGRHGTPFTELPKMLSKAKALSAAQEKLLAGRNCENIVFMARIGRPINPNSETRSVRRPLAQLLIDQP